MNKRKMIETIKKPLRPYYHVIARKINKPNNDKKVEKSREYIKSLKAVHSGERCFIIGNGPSLLVEDLNKLKNEICFGTNCIYKVYDKTNWRPTYYCSEDIKVIKAYKKEISALEQDNKFICIQDTKVNPNIKGAHYLKLVSKEFYPMPPLFSSDISQCVYSGSTVTYACIQMAVYMGFSAIILIGVDHNFGKYYDSNGDLKEQPNIQDHFYENGKNREGVDLYKSELAYKTAKQYAEKHGVKIYNATRGGKLEVFQRVNFDTLF